MMHQYLDLAQGGAGDAYGTGPQLLPGQKRRVVILEVRAQLAVSGAEKSGHLVQLRLHCVEVDQQSRRYDLSYVQCNSLPTGAGVQPGTRCVRAVASGDYQSFMHITV
jgi:hypothetical protein